VLFLSFSGYGLQVDDVDGYHDEGLDEAILPTDFADGVGGDFSVIVLSDIHDALMSAPQDCTVTIVMDCDHATSLVDVSGTVDGGLVKGLKLNSTCGFHGHNAKMKQAEHNRAAWLEEPGISVGARPRFQPKMEIANPRKSRVPTRTAMSRSSPRAFCYSAAGHGQTALELQVTDVVDGRETMQQHGALSWSFVHALEDLRCDCTHTQLFAAIEKRVLQVKEKHHYRMDQEVIFTFSKPLAEPSRDKVLRPVPGASLGSQQRGRPSFGSRSSGSGSFPAIVPPPPPGFLGSGASLPSGGDDGEGSRRPPPRAYASFAQPEDRQSQLASAGLQIWRAAWSPQLLEEEEDEEEGRVNTAGSTSRFDVMDPSDFRVPVETSLAVSLLGTAGRIPSASSSGLAAPAGCGGFQAAAAAPLPSPRLAAPSTVASTSDETSTCSPTSSGGEASFAPTRSPSLSEESSCAESGTAALPGGYLQSMITAKLGEWAEQIFGQPAKAVAVARAAPLEEAC